MCREIAAGSICTHALVLLNTAYELDNMIMILKAAANRVELTIYQTALYTVNRFETTYFRNSLCRNTRNYNIVKNSVCYRSHNYLPIIIVCYIITRITRGHNGDILMNA